VFLKTGWNRYCLRHERRERAEERVIKIITATLYHHPVLWEGKALSNLAGRFFTCRMLDSG